MKILHFYHKPDSMVTQYVNMLRDTMGEYADIMISDSLFSFKKQLKKEHPDIVHLHGCWQTSTALAAKTANGKGIRFVITPHGQLEPWIIKQDYWRDKFPKKLLYQKKVVRKAYSVITMGRMEENSIKRLGWNPRIEVVHNALITESLTASDMCRLIYSIYQKVLDSDVLKLMNDDTTDSLGALIKAGQTGDDRWLNDREYNLIKGLDDECWRKLLIYSYQEGILETIENGVNAVNADVPDFNPASTPCYYPTRFAPSVPLSGLIKEKSDPNKQFIAMIKAMRKLVQSGKLTISHVVELASFLRTMNIEDDKVAMELYSANLTKFAGKLMQLLSDMASLDEGFMPIAPVNNTGKIEKIIKKHLEI